MPTNENKKQYDMQYAQEKLKRIPLNVQKEKYTEIQKAAQNVGETVSGYIKKAIDERMERTNATSDATDVSNDTVNVVPEQKPERRYKPLTQSEREKIKLEKLLYDDYDCTYRNQIAYTYGIDALNELLEEARQQEAESPDTE